MRDDAVNDDYLFQQAPTRGLAKIRFHDWAVTFDGFDSPNVNIFRGQVTEQIFDVFVRDFSAGATRRQVPPVGARVGPVRGRSLTQVGSPFYTGTVEGE